MIDIEYRIEEKYLVTDADLSLLESRLAHIMQPDIHQQGNCYEIRSLYFDDLWDQCMRENEAGVDDRKKFRIRTYGAEDQPIHLEIKEKHNGMTKKTACGLSREECRQIMEGELPLSIGERKQLNQLQMQMRCVGMRPSVIVFYERTAFVHPVGNVRITFDRNIMATRCCEDFLQENMRGLVPVLPAGMHVLEVKYDELLPDYISRQMENGLLQKCTFSKYYLGRLAVEGDFLID